MTIRTPADLGALTRNTRKKLRLHQSNLAKKIWVSRLWLVEIGKGKPRAEIGLVLRTLDTLRITLERYNIGEAAIEEPPACCRYRPDRRGCA